MPFLRYLLIFLLLPVLSYGQGSVIPTGAVNQATYQRGGYGADSVFLLPVRDTLNNIFITPSFLRTYGRITIRPQDKKIYYFDGNSWLQVGAGGGGGSYTAGYGLNLNINEFLVDTSEIVNYRYLYDTFFTKQEMLFLLAGKQNLLGFTPENEANKVNNLSSPNNTEYPTTLAVSNAIGAIPVLDSNRFIKNDTTFEQVGGARVTYWEAEKLFVGQRDTAGNPFYNALNYGIGIKTSNVDKAGGATGLNITNRGGYTSNIANNFSTQTGAFLGSTVVPYSTGNWGTSKPVHPQLVGSTSWTTVQSGATGKIWYAAGILTSVINGSTAIDIEEANLINATYGNMSGRLNYAIGLRMSVLNRGTLGNTGIWLCESDGDAPFSGNWGIFNYMNMRNYFRGSFQIGNLSQAIPEKFYVEGTMRVTDTARFAGEIRTPILSSLLKTSSGGFVQAAVPGTDYVIPSALTAYQQYADTNTWDATKTFTNTNYQKYSDTNTYDVTKTYADGRYIKLTDSASMLEPYLTYVDTFGQLATDFDVSKKVNIVDTGAGGYFRVGGVGALPANTIFGSTVSESIFQFQNGGQTRLRFNIAATGGLTSVRQPSGVTSNILNSESFFSINDTTTAQGARQMAFGIGKNNTERFGNPYIIWDVNASGLTSPRMMHTNDSTVNHVAFKYVHKVRVDNGALSAQQLEIIAPSAATTPVSFLVREAGSNEIKTFAYSAGGGLSASNFVFNEVPSGTINGSNTAFTLANTPIVGTVTGYKNGQRLTPIADFTNSGTGVTMVVAPLPGDVLLFDYMK